MKPNKKPIIPIFFSCDDNYLPFLSVALYSLKKNASKRYYYMIHVLHSSSISKINETRVMKELSEDYFNIFFDDISSYVVFHSSQLHTRDYYTNSTYYRLFIATLYPQYDKVIYLDSDIVVLGNIASLFNRDLRNNIIAGVTEDVMMNFDVFGNYVEKALGIERKSYVNAGILLINTKLFREERIEDKFYSLLRDYKFYVTQDEDYLNVLCKDRILYLRSGWNKAPIPGTDTSLRDIKIVHYKMQWKPWKYDQVMYGDVFWKYAYNVSYFNDLMKLKLSYDVIQEQIKDQTSFNKLVERAIYDSCDPANYRNRSIADTQGLLISGQEAII